MVILPDTDNPLVLGPNSGDEAELTITNGTLDTAVGTLPANAVVDLVVLGLDGARVRCRSRQVRCCRGEFSWAAAATTPLYP